MDPETYALAALAIAEQTAGDPEAQQAALEALAAQAEGAGDDGEQ